MIDPHTPYLISIISIGKAAKRRDVLYSSSCSCGRWSMSGVTAQVARAEHAAHLQSEAGSGSRSEVTREVAGS